VTVLGIDGGGSKTVFLLEDDAGKRLARIETGPSNWLSVGPEAAQRAIQTGIAQLSEHPEVVCAGFAGAGRPEGAAFYQECLAALLPNARVFIETDATIAYAGAIGIRPGVLLIAGTGSIAVSRTPEGAMNRFGGWGPMFGDEGAGFWIGRETVRAALLDHDRGETTEVMKLVTATLGKDTVPDVVTAWGRGQLDTAAIARLAMPLFDLHPAPPADAILPTAAAHLRTLILHATQRSNLPAGAPVAVVGSVGNHPVIKNLIGLPFSPAQDPPERGAIALARARINAS
jgi:N-acetylglucosamine kinase-like BadF-type ATPase